MSDETKKLEAITPEELAELRQKREILFKTSEKIASSWLTQQQCIEDLAAYKVLYDQRLVDFNAIQKTITDKYGKDVNIDLQTGVITYGGGN